MSTIKTRCRHPRTSVRSTIQGYRSTIGDDRRADGGVCIIERCERCGAVRKTNSNCGYTASTGWFSDEEGGGS